jgi:2-keto-4-pentenoate hydratase/2-oxohepta-3-ene-1,7-dioic acid hydratase in catechol pathway
VRIATFDLQGHDHCGVVTEDGVHPFNPGTRMLDLVGLGLPELLRLGTLTVKRGRPLALDQVRLRPPLQPPTVRDFMTFERHVEGVARGFGDTVPEAWYAEPVFYFSNPYSMIGTGEDVPVPPGCQVFDFELEVAAVIGAPGRDLAPAQAREHIIGYTLLNDWSARDLQGREMQVRLGPSKGKDSATTLGPWLVTADELQPRRDTDGFLHLGLTVHVNGIQVGQDTLANMAWTFEELAAHASRGTVVHPGDILGSGTCGNGGCLAELWGRTGQRTPPPLQPGDTVTLTAEGIGTVSNTVIPGLSPATSPVPAARRRL